MVENERLDRIEQHLRLLKENDNERTLLLLSIKASLVGSDMNGNRGVVSAVHDIDNRVKALERHGAEIHIFIKQAKWVVALIITALLTLGLKMIEK